jgi:hypothetical protein
MAGEDAVEGECGPVLCDVGGGVHFREDGLVEALREGLPEEERGKVIDVDVGLPAAAKGINAGGVEEVAAFLITLSVVGEAAAVVDTIEIEIEVGALLGFAAEIYFVGKATLCEILRAVHGVVAAVDGPIVPEAVHKSAAAGGAGIGCEEAAFARLLLK